MSMLTAILCVALLGASLLASRNQAAALVLCAGSVASAILALRADLVVLSVLGSVGLLMAGMVRTPAVRDGGRVVAGSMCVLLALVSSGPQIGKALDRVDAATAARGTSRAVIAGRAELRSRRLEMPDEGCANAADREQCYRSLFKRQAERTSATQTAADLARIVEIDPQSDVVGYCHVTSHDLGGIALRERRRTPMEVFEDFPDRYMAACSWGFSHGVWQAWFDEMQTDEIIGGIAELCLENSTSGTLARAACVHILGHTVVQRQPEKYLTNLQKCLGMPDAEDYVLCVTGGLMEHFGNSELRTTLQGAGTEKALVPCLTIENKFMRRSCIAEAGPQLAAAMSFDPKGMFETCDAQAGEFKEYCYQGAVRGGIGITTAMQVGKVIEACRSAGDRYFEPCIRNSALIVAFNEADRVGADQLCAALGEEEREKCNEAALAGVSLSQRDAE